MFHYFVRDMALSGEPDRMTPGVIVSRLIGASVAVSLVGGSSIFAVMLVGKALAWAALAVSGFWFAGWMFGLPALRRQLRDEPLARIAIDIVHRVLVWTIPLQAVVFMTVAIIAASMMLRQGGGAGSAAENLYEGLMTSVFVFAFLLAFGGMMFLGYLMIVADVGSGGLGWKLLGWLLVLGGVAVFFPGFLYLEDGLLALRDAWGPGRASLALFGAQTLASFLVAGGFGAWVGKPVGGVCLSERLGLAVVARGRRLHALRLGDAAEAWASAVKQPKCALGAGGSLVVHDLPGDLAAVRTVESGQVQATLGPLKAALTAGAVSPDGRLVALLDEDGYLSVWTVAEGSRLWERDTGFGDDGLGLAFADGTSDRLVATRRNGTIAALAADTGDLLAEHDSASWVDGDAFTQTRPHPGGRAWTVATTQVAWAFAGPPDAPRRGPRGELPGEGNEPSPVLTATATNADGSRLAVTNGRRVAVFGPDDVLLAHRDFGKKGAQAIALSDDGTRALVVGRRAILDWSLPTDTVREIKAGRAS